MTRHPILLPKRGAARRQRGAATLIVVMLLFFIISMVAAYTSRNLIFEQRTSANQYRSTQAFEAAEAGLDWAIAQLNAGRMTSTCAVSTDDSAATELSFAQRYLTISPSNGAMVPRVASSGGSVLPRCVFDTGSASGWRCHCPVANAATTSVSAPGGTGPAPAFAVRLIDGFSSPMVGPRADLIQLEANSCTRLDATGSGCLSFTNDDRGGTGDGVGRSSVLLALRGAITRPPAAALTVSDTLAALPSVTALSLTNQNAAASGITLHTSGAEPVGITRNTTPGTPSGNSVITTDSTLAPAAVGVYTSPERRFALYFGVRPDTYFRQPGMVEVNCSAGCDAASVNLALLRNPGRAIRVRGAGTLTIGANIGSASAPALLIVEGDVSFSSGVAFVGLLYGRKVDWAWAVGGPITITGAAVAEGGLTLTGGGATSIVYDAPTLTALRVSYGTFVRVPGSWKDFQ